MDMSGEERIPASKKVVWNALNNANVLKKCIPGCETLEKNSPTEMVATVKVKVTLFTATFKADIKLSNLNPQDSYTITWEGQGGIAGFAKGSSDVQLREDGEATVLTYQVKAEIGGKLAMLGSKMIESSSKRIVSRFFARLNAVIAKRAAAKAEA